MVPEFAADWPYRPGPADKSRNEKARKTTRRIDACMHNLFDFFLMCLDLGNGGINRRRPGAKGEDKGAPPAKPRQIDNNCCHVLNSRRGSDGRGGRRYHMGGRAEGAGGAGDVGFGVAVRHLHHSAEDYQQGAAKRQQHSGKSRFPRVRIQAKHFLDYTLARGAWAKREAQVCRSRFPSGMTDQKSNYDQTPCPPLPFFLSFPKGICFSYR